MVRVARPDRRPRPAALCGGRTAVLRGSMPHGVRPIRRRFGRVPAARASAPRPLLALTTRPPTRREASICLRAGAASPWSVPIGREAVFVLANGPNWPGLDSADLHRALAASIPGPGGVPVPNAARSWRDVDAGLPEGDIDVLLPGPGQAARDLVERTVLQPGCLGTAPAKEISAAADRERVCKDVRAGIGVTEADPDLDVLAWLRGRPGTSPGIDDAGRDRAIGRRSGRAGARRLGPDLQRGDGRGVCRRAGSCT